MTYESPNAMLGARPILITARWQDHDGSMYAVNRSLKFSAALKPVQSRAVLILRSRKPD